LPGIQEHIDATLQTGALIFGAVATIITKVDIIAGDESRFVNFPVTVIIESIAELVHRFRGVTYRESIFGANTQARTGARIVGQCTGRRQPKFNGALGARTLTRVINALAKLNAIDGSGRQT